MSAWALLVVSSEGQAETLPHQRAWAEETAREKGWTIGRVLEGVASGKDGPRRIVRELLVELRALEPAHRPRYVMMIRLDRVGRGDVIESQIVLRDLKELGVRVWTRDAGEERIDSAMEQLISAAKSAVAAHENEVKRDKALAVYRRRRAAGMPLSNRRPFGLERGPDGHDIAHEPYATVIRTMFELRGQGLGYGTIAGQLLAITPPYRLRNGKEIQIRWNAPRVREALLRRVYVGPIIDEVAFQRAQHVTESAPKHRRGSGRYEWPLAGAIHCSCGRGLLATTWGLSPKRIRYYVCRAMWVHGKPQLGFRADRIEEQFIALLQQLSETPELIEDRKRRAQGAPSSALIARAIQEARRRSTDLARQREKVWELHATGKIRDDALQERLDAVAAQRAQVDAQVADLEGQRARTEAISRQARDVAETIARAVEGWTAPNATVVRRQAIARSIALAVGGLCVEEDGTLSRRTALDRGRQSKGHRAK